MNFRVFTKSYKKVLKIKRKNLIIEVSKNLFLKQAFSSALISFDRLYTRNAIKAQQNH